MTTPTFLEPSGSQHPLTVVFLGTPAFALPTLEALLADAQFVVQAVVTQPDRPAGRGQKHTASPVKQCALAHGLPVYQPQRIRKEPDLQDTLRELTPDFFVTVAFGQILSAEVLAIPRLGTVNVHASLLPAWRGPNPIQHALLAGDTETGLTTMLTELGVDTGPILKTCRLPITTIDTTERLTQRLAAAGGPLLLQTLRELAAGTLAPTPQNHALATHAPKCSKEDAVLDWTLPAPLLERRIRGLLPWPGAIAQFEGQPLKVLAAVLSDTLVVGDTSTEPGQPPGSFTGVDSQQVLWVQTGQGALGLQRVQPPNKAPMPAGAWVNGVFRGQPVQGRGFELASGMR
jgi:methionyl-tRNA formyltransferase